MQDIRIDVGLYTYLTIDLSSFDFDKAKYVIFTIKNNINGPKVYTETFTTAEKHSITITPSISRQISDGAQYDFIGQIVTGTDDEGNEIKETYKLCDNGRIILRRGIGDGN